VVLSDPLGVGVIRAESEILGLGAVTHAGRCVRAPLPTREQWIVPLRLCCPEPYQVTDDDKVSAKRQEVTIPRQGIVKLRGTRQRLSDTVVAGISSAGAVAEPSVVPIRGTRVSVL